MIVTTRCQKLSVDTVTKLATFRWISFHVDNSSESLCQLGDFEVKDDLVLVTHLGNVSVEVALVSASEMMITGA
jgi:hypothetical protein